MNRWDVPQYENQIVNTFRQLKKGGSAIYLVYSDNPEHQIKAYRLFDIPIIDTATGEGRQRGVHRLDLMYVPATADNRECYYFQAKLIQGGMPRNVTPASIGLTRANAEYLVRKFLTLVNFTTPTANELSAYLSQEGIRAFGKSFLARKRDDAGNMEFAEEEKVKFDEMLEMTKEQQNEEFSGLNDEMKNKWYCYKASKDYDQIIDCLKNYTIRHANNAEPGKKYKYGLTEEETMRVSDLGKQFFRLTAAQVRQFDFNFQEGERVYGEKLSAVNSSRPNNNNSGDNTKQNTASNIPF